MKKIIAILFVLVFLATAGVVLASPGNKYGKAVTPPFPQPAEKDLKKVIFIRYAPGKEPEAICGNDICEKRESWKKCPEDCQKPGNGEEPTPSPEPSACFDFLSGAQPKWNWVEDYYSSTNGLRNTSSWATGVWNGATSATIFGDGYAGDYDWGDYDLINSVSYGNYGDPNVIAVAAIWFRGKNIYEYDIMFDEDYFPGNGSVDLDTVALHEFGHGAGLNDLYKSECSDEVMYGYYDGVKKELRDGDITGIKALYGE